MATAESGLVVSSGLIVRERAHPDKREVVTSPGMEGELLFNVATVDPSPDGPILNPLSAHSVTLEEIEVVPGAYMPAEEALAAELRYWQSDSAHRSIPLPVIAESIAEAPKMYQDWGASRYVRYGDYGLQIS